MNNYILIKSKYYYIFADSIIKHPMKIRTSEIIAGLFTTFIFVGIFSFVFDTPNFLPDVEEVKSWFKSDDSKSPTKKKKEPSISSGSFGKVLDNFNGVNIYYNGRVSNVQGRNVTEDGYNLGLKFQCVEFVKRYYYEYYNHKMPNSYGNAKDFYNYSYADGAYNKDRGLNQYSNPSYSKPEVGDLLVFGPTQFNQFGHVAIVSKVKRDQVQIVQQNPGSRNPSRQWFPLIDNGGSYNISHQHIIGWLRR